MPLIEAGILSQAVRQRLYAIRPLVQEYQRELPDTAWQNFIEGINTLLDLAECFHAEAVARCKSTLKHDAIANERDLSLHSKVALRFLANIHQSLLPFLQKGTQRAEYLLLPTIQRIVSRHAESAQVVLLPDFDFNYGYLGLKEFAPEQIEKFEPYLPTHKVNEFKERAKKLCKWNVFLQYPISESESALNLCVLTHELSHFFDHHEELYKKYLPQKLDEGSFKALVDKRCGMTISEPGQMTMEVVFSRATIQNNTYKQCISLIEKWLREIIADVLAVHALGPAYFFSLVEYFAHAASENSPASTHPAMAIRLKLLVEELENLGYLDMEGPLKDILTSSARSARSEAETTKHEEEALVAYETIKSHLPTIQEKLRDLASSFAYVAERYKEEVPPIIPLLLKGVAPVEHLNPGQGTCEPNNPVAIVNAGWEVYKTRYVEFKSIFWDRMSDPEALANLNQMLLKAVEASEVVQRWPKEQG
ncbi:MAG: hypothetical protein M1423_09580 [Acidobacteria bacterium]|nr:hypothetical protein [Acidobacteriota bacterium]